MGGQNKFGGPGPNPSGLCMCGCGDRTPLARQGEKRNGNVAGTPVRYIPGHKRGKPPVEGDGPNLSGLCMCGCGRPAPLAKRGGRARGEVAGKPRRFINGHQHHKPLTYDVDPDTGCWSTPVDRQKWERDGEREFVYRRVYREHHGPIPEGFDVHHTCENSRCVNPDHLRALSHADHMALHVQAA